MTRTRDIISLSKSFVKYFFKLFKVFLFITCLALQATFIVYSHFRLIATRFKPIFSHLLRIATQILCFSFFFAIYNHFFYVFISKNDHFLWGLCFKFILYLGVIKTTLPGVSSLAFFFLIILYFNLLKISCFFFIIML